MIWIRKLWFRVIAFLCRDVEFREVAILEKWAESEKQEKEFYRNLLLKKANLLDEQEKSSFDYEQAIEGMSKQRPRTWHHARRALELRDRERYWRDKIAQQQSEEK